MIAKEYLSEIIEEIIQAFAQKIKSRPDNNELIKWAAYSRLMFQWMQIKQKGECLTKYLEKYGCKKVAVYGLGEAGKLLCNEILQSQGIKILYIIDRAIRDRYKDIPVISPDMVDDEADAVIVTPVYCYLEIANNLCDYTHAKIISLEDMVLGLNGYEGG